MKESYGVYNGVADRPNVIRGSEKCNVLNFAGR